MNRFQIIRSANIVCIYVSSFSINKMYSLINRIIEKQSSLWWSHSEIWYGYIEQLRGNENTWSEIKNVKIAEFVTMYRMNDVKLIFVFHRIFFFFCRVCCMICHTKCVVVKRRKYYRWNINTNRIFLITSRYRREEPHLYWI